VFHLFVLCTRNRNSDFGCGRTLKLRHFGEALQKKAGRPHRVGRLPSEMTRSYGM
jgi:hypothetical protein